MGCRLVNSSEVPKHSLSVRQRSTRGDYLCQVEPRGVSNSCLPNRTLLRFALQRGWVVAAIGSIYEEACAFTHSLQPSALLPPIYSKFSFLLLTVTIWPLLMIYTSYPSLTDRKDPHGNFLPSSLIPLKFPNNFTKCGFLVKLLMKQALINIRVVLQTHSQRMARS